MAANSYTANSTTIDLLNEAAEFLEGYEDVADGDYGEPRPNKAMQLRSMIDREIERLKSSPCGPNDAQDAARYRWLRAKARTDTGEPFICCCHMAGYSAWTLEHADGLIDGAMRSDATPLPTSQESQ